MSTVAIIRVPALTDADDTALAARFAGGDAAAFEQVVALYRPRVTRLAYRLLGWRGEVEDVVQDVFLTALTKCRSFRGESSLWTWLTVITLNRCRSHMRRAALLRKFRLDVAREPARDAPAADAGTLGEETSRRVREAVAGLAVRDREVVVLFYLEHRKAPEIAESLGVSTNWVNVRLHRARHRLKQALADLTTE